jgi:hypothetical protein
MMMSSGFRSHAKSVMDLCATLNNQYGASSKTAVRFASK